MSSSDIHMSNLENINIDIFKDTEEHIDTIGSKLKDIVMQTVEMKPIWDDRGFSHYVGLFKWRTTYGKWRDFKCIKFISTANEVYVPIWLDNTKPNSAIHKIDSPFITQQLAQKAY